MFVFTCIIKYHTKWHKLIFRRESIRWLVLEVLKKEMETLLLWQERTHVLLMMQEEKLSQEVLVLMVDATRLALAVLLVIVKTSIVTFVPPLA
nr:MAG TPA: hypothetical protein [Caudoviricetes sp.]